ncbi:MAG: SCP2 sterol-binding domain-containing protein [Candidatus Sigynarchaeota archaeon]
MTRINEPPDILGLGIRNLLSYREDRGALEPLVANWEKTVVIELVDMYAVSMHFHKKDVQIEPGIPAKFDIMISMSLETLIALANGKTGPVRAFLQGRLKVKKLWRVGTLLKFMKIIIPALKIAGERGAHHGKTHRS